MSDIRPMDIVGVIVVLIIIVACIYLFVIKKGRSEDEDEEDYLTEAEIRANLSRTAAGSNPNARIAPQSNRVAMQKAFKKATTR
jgi:hypothetical protein